MREITRSLFVVVLSFGLVTTLTIASMRSSYQETKTQSGKIRLFAVDAFSDLSRNLTSALAGDSSASAGDSSASAGDSSASAGDSSASASAGGSSASAGTDNGGG
jgi:hypothetical protein